MVEESAVDRKRRATDAGVGQTIVVDSRQIHRGIAIAVGALLLGALWSLVAVHQLGLSGSAIGDASVRFFDLDEERGLPAAFSFVLLFATACAVFATTWAARAEPSVARYTGRWRVLAFAMVFAAFDEAFVIHEWLSGYLRTTFGLTGFLYHAWVIPYAVGVLLLAALMATPVSALPRRTAVLMIAGGGCYVLGAAGVEMIGAQLYWSGAPPLLQEAEILVEELLEWAGVWIFLTGVLSLLSGTSIRFDVR